MFFRAEVQDSGKVANKIDTKLTLNRFEPNLVNEASKNGDSFFPGVLLVERLAQIQDLSAVARTRTGPSELSRAPAVGHLAVDKAYPGAQFARWSYFQDCATCLPPEECDGHV